MSKAIEIGHKVAFSRQFLQSTRQITGWAPFARGHVTALDTLCPGCTLATIQWDGKGGRITGETEPETWRVNVDNLVRVDRIHLGKHLGAPATSPLDSGAAIAP